MKCVGIAFFPGGQTDSDFAFAMRQLGFATQTLGHTERDLTGCDAVVLPSPMSFGGYFRPGALAAKTPLAKAIASFAQKGGPVLGMGDGFAVLTELKLLPGALLPNMNARFFATEVACCVADTRHLFFQKQTLQACFHLHVASPTANYVPPCDAAAETVRVALRFPDNTAFSSSGIAAVVNTAGNVLGMLPILERSWQADGGKLLASMFSTLG